MKSVVRSSGPWAAFIVLACALPATAQLRLVIDTEGRLLNVPPMLPSPITTVLISIHGATNGDLFEVRYRPLETPDNTATPALTDALATVSGGANFTIPVSLPNPPFLLYSVVHRTEQLKPEQLKKLEAEQKQLQQDITTAEKALSGSSAQTAVNTAQDAVDEAVTKAEPVQTAAKLEIKRLEAEIAALGEDIKAFSQRETATAVDEIIRLQGEIRKLRASIGEQQKRIESAQATVTAAEAILEKAEANLQGSSESTTLAALQAQLNASINRVQTAQSLRLRRVGLLVLRPDARTVYYRTTVGARDKAIAVERISPVPPTTTQHELFAVIVNRRVADFPEPFSLTYTMAIKEVENPTPVRPVFTAKAEAGIAEVFTDASTAYTDFVMPFGRRFPANTVLTVSINTYLRVISKDETTTTTTSPPADKEPAVKTVTTETRAGQRTAVLSSEEYPQIRGLYWFNFTAGVNGSWLRNPSYVRVTTALDDPSTQDNEARYKTEKVDGDLIAVPVFGLTVYTRPVDIQAPVGKYERWVPAPTIGFGFENPHENIFLGGSHEVSRNVQAWWGVHFGKINKLQKTSAIDDPKSNTAPVVERRFSAAPYLGLSFNLNVIRTIFGT